MWWNGSWPAPWMSFGPIIMLVFVIVCVAMMVFMMRGGMMHGMMHGRRHSRAIDILNERYARGEIDKAEYDERRRLLEA